MRLAGRERVVGGDDREHRREARVDHPGALRHPADREAAAARRPPPSAHVSVVRIASAASPPPSGESSISPRPASSFGIGSFTPITPVERTSTCSGSIPSSARGLGRGRERVQLTLLAGRRVRDAGVDHDRLRLGLGEVRLRDEHRRGLDAVGREHPGADGGHGRAHDREVELRLADPGMHGAGDEALARAVTAPVARSSGPLDGDRHQTSTPRRPQPGGLLEAEREVRVLDRLPGGALAEIVDRGRSRSSGRSPRPRTRRPRRRRCPAAARGRARPRITLDDVRAGVGGLEQRPRVLGGAHVAGADEARGGAGTTCGTNVTGKPSSCAISGACLCAPTAYGVTFSSTAAACERSFSVRPAPEMPGLAVDDDARRVDDVRRSAPARAGRRSRSTRGSRSAGRWAAGARAARSTSAESKRCEPERSTTAASAGGSKSRSRR